MKITELILSFYDRIAEDGRISSTHISLYMGLVNLYIVQENNETVVKVKRSTLMPMAKISARQTYNKHMRELHDYGYIRYEPSSNQYEVSLIYFLTTGLTAVLTNEQTYAG